jgi:hypothetical protein
MVNPGQLLLQRFLELHDIQPDIDTWTLHKLKHNAPRYIRLKMIYALFKFFHIRKNIRAFSEGKFIKEPYNITGLYDIGGVIDLLYNNGNHRIHSYEATGRLKQLRADYDAQDAKLAFEYILEFRIKLESILTYNNRFLATGLTTSLKLIIVNHFTHRMVKEVELLDHILTEFINPYNATVTLEELNKDYGYPLIDIDEIDFEWI